MPYKNKLNKISEQNQQSSENTVNLIELVSRFKSLRSRIKEINKAIVFIQSYSGPEDVTDLVSETEDKRITLLNATKEKIVKNLTVIKFVIDWMKSSEQFIDKIKPKVGKTKGIDTTLGKFLSLLLETEEVYEDPNVNNADIQTLIADLGDESERFILSIKKKNQDIPIKALQFILGKLKTIDPDYASVKVFETLAFKPNTFVAIINKTNAAISDIIVKSYKKIKDTERIQRTTQDATGDEDLGISDEEARALAALLELSDDDDALEEAKNIDRVLSQDNIEKLFRQKKISKSQHDILMNMLEKKLSQAKKFIKKRQIAKIKDPEKRKAAQQKEKEAKASRFQSLQDVLDLEGQPYNEEIIIAARDFLNKDPSKYVFGDKNKPIEKFVGRLPFTISVNNDNEIDTIAPVVDGDQMGSFIERRPNDTFKVKDQLVKLAPEKQAEPEETQPYRKTDIQLPSDTAAADKEFRMLDKFFNYVSKLTLSENFDLEDLRPLGKITTKQVLEKILSFYDELNPSAQQLFKTILGRGDNKKFIVQKLLNDINKNTNLHSIERKALLYQRELDELIKTGEEVLVGIDKNVFSLVAIDAQNTASQGDITPTFNFKISLKPEDGGETVTKEYNSEDLLKLKDEIIKGRSKEEMDAVREIERLKRKAEEEARKAQEQAEKEELERKAKELEQQKKEAEEAQRRKDKEAEEEALKRAQAIDSGDITQTAPDTDSTDEESIEINSLEDINKLTDDQYKNIKTVESVAKYLKNNKDNLAYNSSSTDQQHKIKDVKLTRTGRDIIILHLNPDNDTLQTNTRLADIKKRITKKTNQSATPEEARNIKEDAKKIYDRIIKLSGDNTQLRVGNEKIPLTPQAVEKSLTELADVLNDYEEAVRRYVRIVVFRDSGPDLNPMEENDDGKFRGKTREYIIPTVLDMILNNIKGLKKDQIEKIKKSDILQKTLSRLLQGKNTQFYSKSTKKKVNLIKKDPRKLSAETKAFILSLTDTMKQDKGIKKMFNDSLIAAMEKQNDRGEIVDFPTKKTPSEKKKIAAENLEHLLKPLITEVVRKKWQKRIT